MNIQAKRKKILSKIFFLIVSVFLCIPSLLKAQQAPNIQWQKCLGGMRSDDSNHYISTSIIKTFDGGCIIVGETNSNDGNVSGNHGLEDVWLAELNPSGTILRQKCFGGSGYEGASCIIKTSDNGYAIAGWTNSNDGDVTGNHGGFTDIWVIKLDVSWNIEWQKCVGGTGWDIAISIIQTSDGGYAISGFTTSNDEGFFNRGYSDAYIVKLNSSGNLQWQKLYGGTMADGGGSILQTSDGGYIFAGVTNSDDSDVSGNHRDSIWTSNDVWIVKIDSIGKMLWQKCLGGSGSDIAVSFIKTSDGGYVLTGETTSTDGDVLGRHGLLKNSDAWVIKFDSSCNILWQKCLGGSNYDGGYSIIQTYDKGYAICGITESNDGDVIGYHGGNKKNLLEDSSDVWVVKLSSSGAIEWQKCLGGTETDYGFAIIQTPVDGGYIIHGRTNSTDGDVSGNHGKEDIWIVKLTDPANTVVNSSGSQSNFAWVYPNPSNDQAHLYLFQSQPIKQIQFYNLLGMQYFPEYQVENNLLSIDAHNLPSGSYIVRVAYLNTPLEEVRKFLHYH